MHISPKSFQFSTDSLDRPCFFRRRSITALLKSRTARSTAKNTKNPMRISSRALIFNKSAGLISPGAPEALRGITFRGPVGPPNGLRTQT